MNPEEQSENTNGHLNRRHFLTRASMFVGAAMLPLVARADYGRKNDDHRNDCGKPSGLTTGDKNIIIAAEIAEALAVTTYTNIITKAPFFNQIPDDDQEYLTAALQEEMSHYALLASVTGKPSPYTSFYYPAGMFTDAQTTLNILVTLEDAFVAAYLVGVRNFSTADLRVTAARIMGIESDHRSLARVIADDLGLTTVTGADGVAEDVSPPNNNTYERTLKWTDISQAVAALTPFVDATAAGKAGFNTAVSYPFAPFTPTVPSALGDFIGFGG